MNESARVLIALVLALVLGALVAASGNATLHNAANLVAPIGTLWVNAIRMTIIPLIVALLITGVASASDGKTIGRIGGRTILVFGLLLAGTALVVIPIVPSVFALLPRGQGGPPPLPACAACLPEHKPRYLMGVGRPQDLLAGVASGIDMFDCVMPTRNGRNALAFTSDGPIRLRNANRRG